MQTKINICSSHADWEIYFACEIQIGKLMLGHACKQMVHFLFSFAMMMIIIGGLLVFAYRLF